MLKNGLYIYNVYRPIEDRSSRPVTRRVTVIPIIRNQVVARDFNKVGLRTIVEKGGLSSYSKIIEQTLSSQLVLNNVNVLIRKGRILDFTILSILEAATQVNYKADYSLDHLLLQIIVSKPKLVRERKVDIRRVNLEKFVKSYRKFVAIEGIILEAEAREFQEYLS